MNKFLIICCVLFITGFAQAKNHKSINGIWIPNKGTEFHFKEKGRNLYVMIVIDSDSKKPTTIMLTGNIEDVKNEVLISATSGTIDLTEGCVVNFKISSVLKISKDTIDSQGIIISEIFCIGEQKISLIDNVTGIWKRKKKKIIEVKRRKELMIYKRKN